MKTFRVATEADDAQIRAMLRDNGMPGWVEMTIEREPSFFAGCNIFGRDWAVIAEDEGNVIGMYSAAVMPVHANGGPDRLGYLGGLRVNPAHRRRIRQLRDGYASIGRLAPASVSCWFTVIAEENAIARRLLEAGVPGLPRYHPQGEYVTFALPAARGKRQGRWRRAGERDVDRVVEFHNAQAVRFQFSPVLNDDVVKRLDFFICEWDGAIQAVAALWDQRAFKQIVARRYRRPLRALLRYRNFYARVFRRIPLPREGSALDQTFIAFLAISAAAIGDGRALLQDLLSYCETPAASVGLHSRHPLISAIERFRPVRYRACVYAVTFNGVPPLSCGPAQPEAALL